MDKKFVTTSPAFEGYTITEYLGIVRGITVRLRNIFSNIHGALQILAGGNIGVFTELCEKTRQEAFELMVQHAEEVGGNAIIGVSYNANEVMGGVSEVLCYGTAVKIKRHE